MMDLININTHYFIENSSECMKQIEECWEKIPLLNYIETETLKDNTLVRFRGMIQDMYTPEYYSEQYEVINTSSKTSEMRCGKYTDITKCKENERIDFESSKNINQERQTLFVVSIPGLNSWVETIEKKQNESNSSVTTNLNSSKRKLNEDEANNIEIENLEIREQNNKKLNAGNSSVDDINKRFLSPEFILNSPLPDRASKSCLIKIYDDFDSLKLNEIIEVVGFLSVDPILSTINQTDDLNDFENESLNPPPSLVPRVHVVKLKKIKQNNPLITDNITTSLLDNLDMYHEELHLVLTQCLLGDKLAADYLICHLISSVYVRKDVLSLGQFSLNISNIPVSKCQNYTKMLYEILEMITTKSYYLPMTLDNMNNYSFTPKKDYDCNRLISGILQLSNNTHLVVDETQLQAGRLDQSGVTAVTALGNLIKMQKVKYDFKFYQMEFDTDVPVLVLSEGKSMLPSDFHVPIKSDESCEDTFNEIFEAAKHYLNVERVNNIRKYLTVLRHTSCEMADSVQELVQQDFVTLRKDKSVNANDLHQLLVLARYVSLSSGQTSVQKESWIKARTMEAERNARIPVKK